MTEQRKFPLVYQHVGIKVGSGTTGIEVVAKNVYTGHRLSDFVNMDAINAAHACNRCEVDDCEFRGDLYNLDCEPGVDCLAAK